MTSHDAVPLAQSVDVEIPLAGQTHHDTCYSITPKPVAHHELRQKGRRCRPGAGQGGSHAGLPRRYVGAQLLPHKAATPPRPRSDQLYTARLFNSSPIQPRRCRILLTKIALLLYTGEKFPTNEATTLFFGISKLFQNKDASLRQMVHLVIKELANSAEDIIMVTSTIMKDTGGSSDAIYRPNAIRALCRIIDVR